MQVSNRIKKLFAELSRRDVNLSGDETRHVEIRHEITCDYWNGRGPCDCDPVIGEVSDEPPSFVR